MAAAGSGTPASKRQGLRAGRRGQGGGAGWRRRSAPALEWVSLGRGERGMPNLSLRLCEGDLARSTQRGGTGPVLSLSWTLATQWCPHPMSSEGAFLRLPQVAHKGGHKHPGCGVLKSAFSARAHRGEATPPAPSWQRRVQRLVRSGRACASFSRSSLHPLSLEVLTPCCSLFAGTNFGRGAGRGSSDHRASGRSWERESGSGAGLWAS